jgi:hypothetical protein
LIVDVGVIGILDEAGLTILGNPGMVCGYVRFIDLDVISIYSGQWVLAMCLGYSNGRFHLSFIR